jgi:hypothetical protein
MHPRLPSSLPWGLTAGLGLAVGLGLAPTLGTAHACKCESVPSWTLSLRNITGDGDRDVEDTYWADEIRINDEGTEVWSSFGDGSGFTAERS